MKKLNVCVLFGGVSPEHEVSLRSAESVLNHLDPEKYNLYPVGITKEGNWILFGGSDYVMLFQKEAGFDLTTPRIDRETFEHRLFGEEYGRFLP